MKTQKFEFWAFWSADSDCDKFIDDFENSEKNGYLSDFDANGGVRKDFACILHSRIKKLH